MTMLTDETERHREKNTLDREATLIRDQRERERDQKEKHNFKRNIPLIKKLHDKVPQVKT